MEKGITLTFTNEQAFSLITGVQVLLDQLCIIDSGIILADNEKAGVYQLNQLSKRLTQKIQGLICK